MRDIGFGAAVVAGSVALVLLLPVLLPLVALHEAWEVRKLARTRCVACASPIGLQEIRRAKREAAAKGHTLVTRVLAQGARPRIVAVWEVVCPACGRRYTYRPSEPRAALVAEAPGP